MVEKLDEPFPLEDKKETPVLYTPTDDVVIYIHKGQRWNASIFVYRPKMKMVATLTFHETKEELLDTWRELQIAILQGKFQVLDENEKPI